MRFRILHFVIILAWCHKTTKANKCQNPIEDGPFLRICNQTLDTLHLSNGTQHLYLKNVHLNWTMNKSFNFQNLESVSFIDSKLDAKSIKFSAKLKYMKISNVSFINGGGNLSDLVKSATRIETFFILNLISDEKEVVDLFENFTNKFPVIKFLDTGKSVIIRHEILKKILQSSVQELRCTIESELSTDELGFLTNEYFTGDDDVNSNEETDLSEESEEESVPELSYVTLKKIFYSGSYKWINMISSDESGHVSLRDRNITVFSLPGDSMRSLYMSSVNLLAEKEDKVYLNNLVGASIYESVLNPNSVKFSEKLTGFRILGTTMVNGNFGDLVKTASGLTYLRIDDMSVDIRVNFSESLTHVEFQKVKFIGGALDDFLVTAPNLIELTAYEAGEADFSKLPFKNLTKLRIVNSYLNFPRAVIYPKLNSLEVSGWRSTGDKLFHRFDKMFPVVSFASVQMEQALHPTAALAMFKSSAIEISFEFNFDPQIKTFDFGKAMKIISDSGLSEQILSNYTKPDDSGFRQTILRVYFGRNSSQDNWKWIRIYDYDKTEDDPRPKKLIVMTYVYFSCLALLVCFGIISNMFSFLVLLKLKVKNSCEIVLLTLTSFDSIVILTYLVTLIYSYQLFYDMFVRTGLLKSKYFKPEAHVWMSEQNSILAFFIYPLNKTAYTGSVYTTIFISFERFLAICYPLKSRRILSSQNSKYGLILILTWSIFLNLPRWIESIEWSLYSETSTSWNEYYKPTILRMNIYVYIYHGCIWITLMYMLPFVLIGYFNFKIFQQVLRSKKIRETLSNSQHENENGLTSLTKILLCIVIVFVFCNLCHITIIIYYLATFDQVQLSTIEAISCVPLIINSSVNFIIYIVLGKNLREQFINLWPKFILSCLERKKQIINNVEMNTLTAPRSKTTEVTPN